MERRGLTSDELRSLLTPCQLAAAEGPPKIGCAPTPTEESSRAPESLDRHQLGALRDLHDRVASAWQRVLTDEIQQPAQVRLIDLSPAPYGQFVFDRPIPTCFVVLQAAPIDTVLVLDLEPRILFALLDMMLGSRSPSPPERRPLTEIETRLAARLVRLCLEAYREAWEHVLTLDLQIERFEHNPQQARTMRGSEQTLIVDFEICAGKERGHLNLCMPTKAIEKMTSRLTAFAERSEP